MTNPKHATTTSRGRTYHWRDEEFVSVTTIIGQGVPKPALKGWGERLVAETAVAKQVIWSKMTDDEAVDWLKRSPYRESGRAAVRGSDIHAWAERWALNQRPQIDEFPEAQQGYARSFASFVAEWQPVWEMAEASVYNRRWGYAGTLDSLVRIERDGLGLLLCDTKTGKGVYGEVALQLAAYRHAEFIGAPDGSEVPMPSVDGCAVLHLTPTDYELIPVEAGEEAFRYFLYAQQVAHFCNDASKRALGAPLVAPARRRPPRPTAPPNVAALVD